jgi:protein-S-isoprenylcysteine O-methyltransferase Ste14
MKTLQKTTARSTFWAVAIFYFLIAFEFFYMASPFAVYFYSVYRPGLVFLNKFPSVAWLSGFFLPHLVENTQSTFLNLIPKTGFILTFLGLFAFLVCASQVYYSKLFKKGVVSGGLYKYIRHPQYTAFSVCSFGLLLLWPRYLTLLFFVCLLFAYYWLAKMEEQECEAKFGESYLDYKNSKNMFLPFKFPILINNISDSVQLRPVIRLSIFIIVLGGSFALAKGLKAISVKNLYHSVNTNEYNLSTEKLSKDEIDRILGIAKSSEEVDSILDKAQTKGIIKMINYIVPSQLYISEIPMVIQDNAPCHISSHSFDNNLYKVIFTSANIRSKIDVKGYEIPFNTVSTSPLLEVWVNIMEKKVIKILKPQPRLTIRYKNIPEPVF